MDITKNNYSGLIDIMSGVFGSFPCGEDLMRSIDPEEIEKTGQEKIYTECTFGGAIFAHVKNGRVIKTEPLTIPEDVRQYRIEARGKVFEPPRRCLPDMWGHGYRRWIYDPSRLRYPLKRVGWQPGGKGTYDNRGLAEFVRISWDEALELVTAEIKRIKETYGNSAISFKDHSHSSWGTIHGNGAEKAIAPKFFNILGGFTDIVIGTCSWAGWVSGPTFMYGFWWSNGINEGTDTLTDTLQNSRMVVYWSMDATKSTRMYHGHEAEIWRWWIRDAGIKTVMVSPEFNDTAAAHADRWVSVYPGSDAAMAAAIMYIWITEGTYDQEYIKTHTVGFEQLRDYLLGKDDGKPKTPEWAGKICGINPETIIGLAREWAAGPTTIYCQLGGANRGWFGHEWARMMVALQTLQGLGKPGVNLVSLGWCSGGAPFDKNIFMPGYTTGIAAGETRKPITNPIPQTLHAIDFTNGIFNPPIKWRGGSTGAVSWSDEFFKDHIYPIPGYSEIKMIFTLGGGQFQSYPNLNWRAKGFLSPKIETIVTATLFMEPAARYADILLPACTDFERNDISMLGCGGLYVPYSGSANHQVAIFQQKCIEPLGQSMSDFDIFYHLAKKLGIEDELYEGDYTDEAWVKRLFEASSLPKFINYDNFKKTGYFVFPFPENYETTPALRWFYEDGNGLATPSGKIELYSKILSDHYGEDNPEIPPIPKYIEPKDGRNSPIGKRYPLVAFVSHPKFRFHTMMENVSWLRDLHKIKSPDGKEYEPLWMNPIDGEARSIKHGDVVLVFNDRGEALGAAYITERIKPGTIRMFYGSFWEPENPRNDKSLDRGGSFNVLTTDEPMSCHAHLQRVHHTMVEIRKWEERN